MLETGGQVDVIFFMIPRCSIRFYTVSKLLSKMEIIGVPAHIIKWVASYLRDCKQHVHINGYSSRLLNCVSQGSVLGHILFNIYINDLVQSLDSRIWAKLFADDCVIFHKVNSVEDQATLKRNFQLVEIWYKTWDMVINF